MKKLFPSKRGAFVASLVLCLLFSTAVRTQSPSSGRSLAAELNEYMNAEVAAGRFSGSVLVARGGNAIFSKGYGMANREYSVLNSPHTKFRLASVTKQFTSMAVMILKESGKLDLSAPICKYLENCPAAWEQVTVRHLLAQTSGIPDFVYSREFGTLNRTGASPAALVELVRNQPLNFRPGERFEYSNINYVLLGLIIEHVSGRAYDAFLKENIFDPLGMKDSGYDDISTILPGRASGYNYDKERLSPVNTRYVDIRLPFAAGALYSTTEDMLRWDNGLSTGRLVSRGSMDEIFSPVKSGYAYGWAASKHLGRIAISHTGIVNGFRTSIRRYPGDRLSIIVLSNFEPARVVTISSALAAIVFGKPHSRPVARKTVKVASAILKSYEGTYRGENVTVAITPGADKLMVKMDGLPEFDLLPGPDGTFFNDYLDVEVRFQKDAKGDVTRLKAHALWWAEIEATRD